MSSATAEKVNLNDITVSKDVVRHIPPTAIKVIEGFNCRRTMGNLNQLKESIRAMGVKTPMGIQVIDGEVCLRKGHRRLRAVQELIKEGHRIESIPVLEMDKDAAESDVIIEALIADNDALPLSPVEEAEAIVRLLNPPDGQTPLTPEEIRAKTGRSLAHISNAKILAALPNKIKNNIAKGVISATTALAVARDCNGDENKIVDKIEKMIEKAQSQGKKKATAKHREDKKTKKDQFLDMADRVIAALKSDDEEFRLKILQEFQFFRDEVLAAKQGRKKKKK